MNATLIASVLACLLALTISGQTDSAQTPSEEDKAFAAITALMSKTKQGGEHPTEQDLKTRREAGTELAKTARQFSRKYPESKKTEDAQALVNVGLYEATLAGDPTAAEELEHAAADALKDAKMPEMLKLYTFVINYVAQWAKKEGRHTLDQGSADFQKAYMEGLFA